MADVSQVTWQLIDCVLFGVPAVPIFAAWANSHTTIRRKNDPARVGFTWLKAALPFALLGLLLTAVAEGLVVAYLLGFDYLDVESSDYLLAVGNLFLRFADVALLVTFIELGNGFLLCLDPVKATSSARRRKAVLAIAFVLAVLELALCVQYCVDVVQIIYVSSYAFSHQQAMRTHIDLLDTYFVLYLTSMLVVLGFVCHVTRQCIQNAALRHSAILLTVAGCLNVIRYIWEVAEWAEWTLPRSSAVIQAVMDPIFYAWPLFVLFMLLYAIGIRRQNGLWTTPQPWMERGPSDAPIPASPNWTYQQSDAHGHAEMDWQGVSELPPRYSFVSPDGAELHAPPAPQQLDASQPPQQLYGSSPLHLPAGPHPRYELN